jgi:putative salt-induced outer membrane protein YdiY
VNSIIPGDKQGRCFICGRYCNTETHHIFGASDRDWAEKYGLKVELCYEHHQGTNGVHGKNGKKLQEYLHQTGQETFEEWAMKRYSLTAEEARDKFRQEFRKSYL